MKTKTELLLFFVSVLLVFSCSRLDEAESEDDFVINPIDESSLQIISPARNESLTPGSIIKIKWDFPDNIDQVRISIYRKSSFTQTITIKTNNTGYYEWKIPDDIKNSVHYRINISAYEKPYINKFSEYFFILKTGITNTDQEGL